MEELIEQAKDELELIPVYASWKMWEQKPPSPQDDDFSGESHTTNPCTMEVFPFPPPPTLRPNATP